MEKIMNNNTVNNMENKGDVKTMNNVKVVMEMAKNSGVNKVKEVSQNNIRKHIIPEVRNENEYMDFLAKVHGEFQLRDRNLNVGIMTVFIDTMSAILLIEDDKDFVELVKLCLSEAEIIKELYGDIYQLKGTGTYIPVVKYKGNKDGKEFEMVVMSTDIEKCILNQIPHINLDNAANLRALLRDINDVGRMYQELTLDAAKKLYNVVAAFYQKTVRAESTIHLGHTDLKFNKIAKGDKFHIFRNNTLEDKDLEIGKVKYEYKKTGEIKKAIVRDILGSIQNQRIDVVEENVNVVGLNQYENTKLGESTIADLNLHGETGKMIMDIHELIIKVYNFLVAEKAKKTEQINSDRKLSSFQRAAALTSLDEAHKAHIDKLSNLARFYTKDLSMVEAGRVMFGACNITINAKEKLPVINDKATCTAYLHIAPELALAYITAQHADMKVCGYKLLGNTSQVSEGDVIEFVGGNAVGFEKLYLGDAYTGKLRVETVNDVLSAVVDINELLEANRIPHTPVDSISLRIYEGGTFDVAHFEATGTVKRLGSHAAFDAQGVFNGENVATLHPVYRYKDDKGKDRVLNDVIVITKPSIDPDARVEIPVCHYLCYSATMEKIFAGLTFKTMNKKNDTGSKVAWGMVSYGEYRDVEMRLSVPAEELTVDSDFAYDFSKTTETKSTTVEDAFAPKSTEVDNTPKQVESSVDDEMLEAFGSSFGQEDFDQVDYSEFDM